MKVVTAQQMAAIDRETIAGGIPGEELMERAGTAMAGIVLDVLFHADDHDGCGDEGYGCGSHGHDTGSPRGVLVLCGKGNNGGDGLVVARHVHAEDIPVRVLLLAEPEKLSPTARVMFERLPEQVQVTVAPDPDRWCDLLDDAAAEAALLVDAVFGTGITPPLRPGHADLFRAVNDLGLPCVALDIPSGVCGDTGAVDPVAVAADVTATVQLPKLGLLLAPGRDFAGDIEVVDIGFSPEICDRHAGDIHWLDTLDYAGMLPARPSFAHKYRHGKVLLVAGSRRFGGAAHLATLGALRSGAGLVTLAAPTALETPLRSSLPEAVIRPLEESAAGTIMPPAGPVWEDLTADKHAMAVGPGLDGDPATDAWVVRMQAECSLPLVVDADGLNAWARQGKAPAFCHKEIVLTPHPGEMARLLGVATAEVQGDRFAAAGAAAAAWGAVVMLKGSPSLIAVPDGRVFINASGDDALARGGSGDVLTGLVGGLLAQGLGALGAALLGAYLHGRAGSLAAEGKSTRSVLVRETAAALGAAFAELEQVAATDAALRERVWPVVDPGRPDTGKGG